MASSPDALQARLDQFEANVRKWQRTNRFWVWGLLAFIAALLIYNPPVGRPAGRPQQTLSARQLVLVDGQGKVRGLLGTDEEGASFLQLEAGQGTAMLVLERDGKVVGRLP